MVLLKKLARNPEAIFAIKREMERTPNLKVTIPSIVNDEILNVNFINTSV